MAGWNIKNVARMEFKNRLPTFFRQENIVSSIIHFSQEVSVNSGVNKIFMWINYCRPLGDVPPL